MKSKSMKKGNLFLIPNSLGQEEIENILTKEGIEKLLHLRCFAVEEIRSARRLLKKASKEFPIDDSEFYVVDKRKNMEVENHIISKLNQGIDVGLISEAGNPCIADPGNTLVAQAHQNQITIKPLIGPSSILLALISSGFNGQQFTFHGYLPKESQSRTKKLIEMERQMTQTGYTQIFMETPFRNQHVLEDAMKSLHSNTLFTISSNLTQGNEQIKTLPISEWKKLKINLQKVPCIFLIGKSEF